MTTEPTEPTAVPSSARSVARGAFVATLVLSVLAALFLRSSLASGGAANAFVVPFLGMVAACGIGLVGILYGVGSGRTVAGMAGTALGMGIGFLLGLFIVMWESHAPTPGREEMIGLEFHNHTPDYIGQSYVDDGGGGNTRAYSSSGGNGVFIYPRQWPPGLTAKVKWTTSDSGPNGSPEETWHEKVVRVERYGKADMDMNVHFLPGGKVRLIVSDVSASDADYRGPPAPVAPADFPYKY